MLEALSDHVLITPILQSEIRAAEVKKRSGLLVAPPQNKRHDFEGLPNQGKIYALPAEYDGPLKVGMRVVFKEDSPEGFKVPGGDVTVFRLKLYQIVAEVRL